MTALVIKVAEQLRDDEEDGDLQRHRHDQRQRIDGRLAHRVVGETAHHLQGQDAQRRTRAARIVTGSDALLERRGQL